MPHLLTAVLATAHGLAVVHYDADFETAATVGANGANSECRLACSAH